MQCENPGMTNSANAWESRIADLWLRADAMSPEALVAAADALASERPDGDAAALFERAAARDSAGQEVDAEAFYRAALATGRLDPLRQSRAVIQLASTLRILGQLDESERLLAAAFERGRNAADPPPLHDEACAFLALTYVAQGRAVEAAGVALTALAPHLTRYRRSVTGNAAELIEDTPLRD
jgi:tetratricopeptide (TPR) repeat protein